MTDTTDIKALIDRLRSLAKTATPGKWWIDSHGEALVAFTDEGIETVLKPEHLRDKAHRDENTGSLSYWPNDSDASWIAAAQPQNIIALLDQLEAERQRADDAHKYGSERDAENESLMLTVGRLRVEIAELKANLANPVVLKDFRTTSIQSTRPFNLFDIIVATQGADAEAIIAAGFTVKGDL